MVHDFVINTENVNVYKYRILTDGIDYTQYMNNPVVLYYHNLKDYENKGQEVIGRCVKLYKKDSQLIASIEFDDEDAYAKTISGKVERGFLRMASMYADVIETSAEPDLVLPGQAYETVTKCKLIEISIVPVGGNDDALKLSNKDSKVNLQKLTPKKEDNMSNLKIIALAVGADENATESVLAEKIKTIVLAKEQSDAKVIELTAKLKGIITAEANALVDEAISLGLFNEALKSTQLAALEADFDGQKAVLSTLIKEAKQAAGIEADSSKIKDVVLAAGGKKPEVTDPKETFDYLQKHDSVKLAKIKTDEPETYKKLAIDYANGVRYTEAK